MVKLVFLYKRQFFGCQIAKTGPKSSTGSEPGLEITGIATDMFAFRQGGGCVAQLLLAGCTTKLLAFFLIIFILNSQKRSVDFTVKTNSSFVFLTVFILLLYIV